MGAASFGGRAGVGDRGEQRSWDTSVYLEQTTGETKDGWGEIL